MTPCRESFIASRIPLNLAHLVIMSVTGMCKLVTGGCKEVFNV